jgi:hypothetical protein
MAPTKHNASLIKQKKKKQNKFNFITKIKLTQFPGKHRYSHRAVIHSPQVYEIMGMDDK